jgi:hypothetical protein
VISLGGRKRGGRGDRGLPVVGMRDPLLPPFDPLSTIPRRLLIGCEGQPTGGVSSRLVVPRLLSERV